jgi:hypothetical protein
MPARLHRTLALSLTHRRFTLNAYELRFATFYQAKEFLENQYKANLATWELLDKASKEALELMPKFPTLTEVIDKAVEINQFVSDANIAEIKKATKRLAV